MVVWTEGALPGPPKLCGGRFALLCLILGFWLSFRARALRVANFDSLLASSAPSHLWLWCDPHHAHFCHGLSCRILDSCVYDELAETWRMRAQIDDGIAIPHHQAWNGNALRQCLLLISRLQQSLSRSVQEVGVSRFS